MTALLAAEDVHKSYGRREVLRGASFAAQAGELTAILGENGSGKSTMLRILAGTLALDRGQISRRGEIGFCPQEQLLYPYLNIDEHLELFAAAHRMSTSEGRRRGDELAETLGFGSHRKELVENLSGGTRQKLNLALALLHDPPIVLLDEPYAGLDVDSYRSFVALCEHAKAEGRCIVIITHLAFEPERFDAVFQLRDGKIVDDLRRG